MTSFACVLVIVFCCFIWAASAQTESDEKLDSCNVVYNCNSGPTTEGHAPTRHLTSQGPPGKLGPKGDLGPVGSKGQKGETGLKGQKGRDADEAFVAHILAGASATSCQDLKTRFGVTTSGYYLTMNPSQSSPVYSYCDFNRYPDVTTCWQLRAKYNITKRGEYIFGRNAQNNTFEPCEFGIYTCDALQKSRPELTASNSGFYDLRAWSGFGTFRVFCRFTETGAVTEIHHDMMEERKISSSCEVKGCYSGAPQYDVSGADLNRIIDNSVSCKQFIKLRCKGVRLKDGEYAWWVSRGGQKMLYWGGATTANYCACGETNSCIKNSHKCNCDQNSESITTSDEGYLTDKTTLPLREIRVGDMGDNKETAWHTIGKLECSGQV